MNEQDWLICTDPVAMSMFLQSRTTDRKLRLFAVTCCRRIWHLFSDPRSRTAVEIAERYADGEVEEAEREAAWEAADQATTDVWLSTPEINGAVSNDDAPNASVVAAANAVLSSEDFVGPEAEVMYLSLNPTDAIGCEAREKGLDRNSATAAEKAVHVALIRDIFGNPFRPIAPDPAWLTTDVLALARGIYDERAFDRMPILADALQDAGCDNNAILDHCRDASATHVRGCWVVDLLLGRK